MFVCRGVGWNAALLEGQRGVIEKRSRYWGTRCDERLLACHSLAEGRTAIVLVLLLLLLLECDLLSLLSLAVF